MSFLAGCFIFEGNENKKACLILNGILAVVNCVVWVGTFARLLKLSEDFLYHLPSLDNIIFSIMLITTYFFILMPTESAFDEKKDLKLLDEVMEEVMIEQSQSDIQELLTTYEGLMHRGIISVEEFEQRKNRLLG